MQIWKVRNERANSPRRGRWKRLTDVEALEILLRLKGDVNFIRWRVLARTKEGEGESRDLAGFGLRWRRRGVRHDGEEAKNSGKVEALHSDE